MREKINIRTMTNIHIWCWYFLVLIQTIHSASQQAQFMLLCNRTLNMLSSPLSIIYTPSSYSSCCNLTLVSESSDQMTINLMNLSTINSPLKISNKQFETVKFTPYVSSNQTSLKSDLIDLPITFSLCQFNLSSFEILINNASKESTSRLTVSKVERTIRGGIVTTIIIFGLLLIIGSVSLALVFVYFRRKHLRQRQFTYSLESTSDDWEPAGTGYHLFDNWTNNLRPTEHNIDNVNIDANEHLPITTNVTGR